MHTFLNILCVVVSVGFIIGAFCAAFDPALRNQDKPSN